MDRPRNAIVTRFLERMQDPAARERNRDRLFRSIAGSLRVAGYDVSEDDVRQYLEQVETPARD